MSKLRAVIGLQKPDTILGKPGLNRLLEHVKTLRNPDGSRIFCALTQPWVVDKSMQRMLETASSRRLTVLSTDFSGFDQSINPYLMMDIAKAIAENWFIGPYRQLFLALVYAEFFQTSLITPFKIYREGPSAMKSGSIFTNFLDSIYNLTSQWYGFYTGQYKSVISQFVQGDDACLLGEGVDPTTFEQATSQLGLVGNASKQYYYPGSLSFCQRTHVLGYPGGISSSSRVFSSIISTEDDVRIEDIGDDKYSYVLAYRTICRLVNLWAHPDFVQLVLLTAKEDKELHLGKDLGPKALINGASNYSAATEAYYKDYQWKSMATTYDGFMSNPVNRVLRGDLPPPPGKQRFEWAYGISYDNLAI